MSRPNERFVIYERREMGILFLLAVVVALFAFTVGVHFGKRVGQQGILGDLGGVSILKPGKDSVPSRHELKEQLEEVSQAAEQSINQSLHNEVTKTGIKLETFYPVDLPRDPKSENAGETTHNQKQEPIAPQAATPPSENKSPAAGDFTLQVSSHPSAEEAQKQVEALGGTDFYIKSVDIKGKGTWYRVYWGRFSTKEEAQKAGQSQKDQGKIPGFIVGKVPR